MAASEFTHECSVLLAEDDSFQRELVSSQLRMLDVPVIEVASAEEALSVLRANQPITLLITDINMLGPLDGWSLAESARAFVADIAVIYTTSSPLDPQRQVEDGIFVQKPYRLETLLEAVDTFRNIGLVHEVE